MTKLFKHQEEAVEFILKNPYIGVLLWHEMGLGKTISSLMALRQITATQRAGGAKTPKTLVLTPKSMGHQWKTETQKFTPDNYPNMLFLPYSQLSKSFRLPMYYDIRSIILDESHYIKTQGTNRLNDLCKLLEAIANSAGGFKGGRIMLLSGTPMLNHAAEIYTTWALASGSNLYKTIELLQDEDRYQRWQQSFTKQQVKSWKTKYTTKYGKDKPEGVENEDLLQKLIGPITHFRRACDCLDLPLKQEIMVDLGLEDDKLLQDADIEAPDAYMALLERLARAKTPHAIDWVQDFLRGSDQQLVVFCPYKFPLYEIQKKIKNKAVMVTGDQLGGERTANIEAFKQGKARVFLATYRAAGEGLNLQNAHTSLYLGYPWSPKIIDQAKARTHRYGQSKRTLHYFMMSGLNDQRILHLLYSKERAINAVETSLQEYEELKGIDSFI